MARKARKTVRAKQRPTSAEGISVSASSNKPHENVVRALVYLLLVVAVVIAYQQVRSFDFVTMDDYLYVTNNPHVKTGLTFESIRWAFTGIGAGNWHPLTWLSLMLDYEFGRMNAGTYHVTNLLLHIANTLLLLFVLTRLTGFFWRSAFVAGLFALHPLHVESVAWISERKDVLSTLFWLLAILAYKGYATRPSIGRYLLTIAAFVFGLMAKPMLVTLPITLLLLDLWPLRRLQTLHPPITAITEKLPLFAITAISCVVTIHAQRAGGAVAPIEALPVGVRIANAIVSYVSYLGNTVWPSGLAPFYPHPTLSIPEWQTVLSAIFLACITCLAFRLARNYPYFTFGWLWYVITMIPVIGIVQVGSQAMADRYTYVPLIGIFIIAAWGMPDLIRRISPSAFHKFAPVASTAAVVVLAILAIRTHEQVRYWRNDITVWEHTIKVTTRNSLAHYNLACGYDERKQYAKAIRHYKEALRIDPNKAEAYNNLGNLYLKLGKLDEAERCLREALRVRPEYSEAHCNLGLLLDKRKDYEASLQHYARSLAADPKDAVVRANYAATECDFGIHLAQQGKVDEAVIHFRKAIEIDPTSANAHYNLAVALDGQSKLDEAITEYREAVRLDPDYADAHNNLGVCLGQKGDYDGAVHHLSEALRIRPDFTKARISLEHFSMLRAAQRK